MSHPKRIVSLFDYSGNWVSPYREAGYQVVQIDLKLGRDVLTLSTRNRSDIYGVLAAPPCTDFAGSGARWWADKDANGETAESVALVEHTLDLIKAWNPVFWALENPVGRLPRLVPRLGEWRYAFDPCDYGEPYTKRTCLWGKFNIPKTCYVPPIEGSKMWKRYGGKSDATKQARSVTPLGFAKAFFEANR